MRFEPLHRDFGVQVLDFDIQAGGSKQEVDALRAAWDHYGLLLFRGQGKLSPERQLAFTSWFGPPDPIDNTGQGDFVTVLHNDEQAGRMELQFHSDQTYSQNPIDAICLHAIALPEQPTSTTFTSGVAAMAQLPADMRETVLGKTLRHKLEMSMAGFDWPVFIADHPLVLPHPRHGTEVLFATEHHAERILEMEPEESAAMLRELFARLYAPEALYEHVWQLHDVLLIDNIALQHARRSEAVPAAGVRALQRVALARETLAELIERARRQQAQRTEG